MRHWSNFVYSAFSPAYFSILAPGDTIINIVKPGDYAIWNDLETEINGRLTTFPERLAPSTTITVVKEPERNQIPLHASSVRSAEFNGMKSVCLGELTFNAPGPYQIAVAGLPDQRSFSLEGPNPLPDVRKFMLAGSFGLPFIIAAFVSAIYFLIRLTSRPAQPKS
jgi:hypothetical protein